MALKVVKSFISAFFARTYENFDDIRGFTLLWLYPQGVYVKDMSEEHCATHQAEHHHGYTADKDAYLKRLRRIEGQVRGIQRMVDEDVYCIDILTQVSAINKALHSVSIQLLEDHVRHCVVDAATQAKATGNTAPLDDKISEAMAAITRLIKS